MLDGTLQFTDVSGPVVLDERLHRVRRNRTNVLSKLAIEQLDEVFHQDRDVIRTIAQRRQLNRENVQPIEQVLTKLALLDEQFQVSVCRGDHAHVNLHRLIASHSLERAVLQQSQHLRLCRRCHVADLVQEDRAAINLLEFPDAAFVGPGEGAAFVAEQLAFQQ